MKTLKEANDYLESLPHWEENAVKVAEPGPLHLEFYLFKETIDFAPYTASFTGTTSDMAYKKNSRGWVDDDVMWHVDFPGLGSATLHLYCTPEVRDMGYYAEFWLEKEPWWNGDDPYECTAEQLGVIVNALPPEHRTKFDELASRSPEIVLEFREMGILPAPTSLSPSA